MGKIFCLMGKTSSGKDTIYKHLTEDESLHLQRIVPYTTRPIRQGEQEGVEYHFVTEEQMRSLERTGRIIERRAYDTVHGIWYYFTVCGEQMDLNRENYITIGTLESFRKMCVYFGRERVVPVYIEVKNMARIRRALIREGQQTQPDYPEMRRRFRADRKDFSEETLRKEGIFRRFRNEQLETCLQEIKLFIQE